MRKIILCLFIILFCFSIGIARLQEEELSKEERAALEKSLEIAVKLEEKYVKILSLADGIKKLKQEIADLEKQEKELKAQTKGIIDWQAIFAEPEEEPEEYDFSHLDGIEPLPGHIKSLEEKKGEDLSWRKKYRVLYPAGEINYLNSLYELYGGGKTDAEKLEKENDRLEDLLRDLRNERSALESDMMMHRLNLEFTKPDLLDYQMALDSAIASAIIAPNPFYDSWLYHYYPIYPIKTDRTNYEPLLFTLCTDSKGKMDWTKYGWLKLLLKKK